MAPMASKSAGRPNRLTGMTARVSPVTLCRTSAGSIVKVSGSQSANTGTAPHCSTTNAVAAMVTVGTITSSPGPTPAASRQASRVPEPELHEMAYGTPKRSAKARSKRAVMSADSLLPKPSASTSCR